VVWAKVVAQKLREESGMGYSALRWTCSDQQVCLRSFRTNCTELEQNVEEAQL